MNHKRDIIERFITDDLPGIITEELKRDSLAEQSQAVQELEEVAQQIKESLGDGALDAEGNLAESYQLTPLGQKYLSLKHKAAGSKGYEALEDDIYNHLYSFFKRYWQDGDFISKRHYSNRRERYAIPYNGEEVYLYWANHDQYYIKSGEYFTDYTYTAPNGVTVHFKLQSVDVEQNNVKGERRVFLPRYEDISWKKSEKHLIVPFEYRPLTKQETIAYGSKRQQDRIIEEALERIPKRLSPKTAAPAIAALIDEKPNTSDGKPVSYLEHHLRQYTRRNTSDFFIHKHLRDFLSRELDFYLKNEVLNLDEIENMGEKWAEGRFQLMHAIKRVGRQIIEFLNQIEEFQKKLWKKRKFVTETFYCITVGNIANELYPEIAGCEEQWGEWKTLFSIDEEEHNLFTSGKGKKEKRIAFLETHPTLVLDTRHFSQDFVDRLLATYDELDEMTDGLLVHGENWQALNLLLEKYRNGVKCIHIDPPYNTQTSGFLYKNDYQHSSWLAMMNDRIRIGSRFLVGNGHFLCHIDENECERLKILFDLIGIDDAGTVIWDKRNPMTAGRGVALQHEYVIWRSNINGSIYQQGDNIQLMVEAARGIIEKNGGVTDKARREFKEWVQNNPNLSGGEKGYYRLDDEGNIYQSVSLRAPEPRTDSKFFGSSA
jgi:adenine-specific DNA-methyltransferase